MQDNPSTTHLSIEGMTCNHCKSAVENALKAVPGVKNVGVDLSAGSATVHGPALPAALITAVNDEGYTANVSNG